MDRYNERVAESGRAMIACAATAKKSMDTIRNFRIGSMYEYLTMAQVRTKSAYAVLLKRKMTNITPLTRTTSSVGE